MLAEDRLEDLELAALSFAESGPVVMRKVIRGLNAASKRFPDASSGAGVAPASPDEGE